jgi:ATP dependent DNA ligase domain
MLKAFDFCIPTRGTKVPDRPDWLHEIKYDGYRLRVERNGDRVRLVTRNGHDWSGRYPWIVESALKNRIKQFVIDGEAVVLGVDGIPGFNALHSRKHDDEVQLYAFDIMALDGDDLRPPPLEPAQDQSGAAACATARRHFRRAVRAGRDWPRLVSRCLQYETRGNGVEASRSTLSWRKISGLGQGQDPEVAGDEPRQGRILNGRL